MEASTGALSADNVISIRTAKADKATMERLIVQLVQDYEERHDCRVVGLSVEFDRRPDGEYRATGVRASVQL